jgi:hypothetical protein
VATTRGDSTQSSAMVCSQGGNAENLDIARGNLRIFFYRGYHTLQHFHSITTSKNRCVMQNNRCHRLREQFSRRCVPRRCLSFSQRFFIQLQRLTENRCFRFPKENGFQNFLQQRFVSVPVKNRCHW